MKPICSLSLDLDNLWSYLKVHGDETWTDYPSYLDVLVPRLLDFLEKRNLRISVFIVGRDAGIESNHRWLRMLADAGHEICNHSYQHEPWLHLYSPEEIDQELTASEEAIEAATGKRPSGFRGPGFSYSPQVLASLVERGYDYDASTFPSFIGPLARAYYFRTARLSPRRNGRSAASSSAASAKCCFRTSPTDGNWTEGRFWRFPLPRFPCCGRRFTSATWSTWHRNRRRSPGSTWVSQRLCAG